MADCAPDSDDDNPVITLQEAIEEFAEMEKVSTAVLGASDPQNCSYSKGYLKRQALYACLTCNPKNAPFFEPAGVCLACSYKCHDGHELVELYTKRNFRCDCGNKKFPDNACLLQKERDDYNEKNSYSQNFSGLYCECHKPYPDPEASEENLDPMVQCIICEDWYHTQHAIPGIIWGDFEDADQSLELICGTCTPKLDFLCFYGRLQAKEGKTTSNAANLIADPASQDSGIGSLVDNADSDIDITTVDNSVTVISEATANDCFMRREMKTEYKVGSGTLWSDGWRKHLCQCDSCKAKYDALKISFLLDTEDTIENYEAVGQAKSDSDMIHAEETFNKQVDELGRVGQIELITGYNSMKDALKEFLKEFADNGKVVSEKDVQEFFENFKATKRRRLE